MLLLAFGPFKCNHKSSEQGLEEEEEGEGEGEEEEEEEEGEEEG